jgi:hypothetical protein
LKISNAWLNFETKTIHIRKTVIFIIWFRDSWGKNMKWYRLHDWVTKLLYGIWIIKDEQSRNINCSVGCRTCYQTGGQNVLFVQCAQLMKPMLYIYKCISWRSGGNNLNTRRKPPTCCQSLTNFITKCIEHISPWAGFELTTLVVIGTDFTGSCKSYLPYITTTTASDDPCI